MTPACERITLDALTDCAAGELPEAEAAAIEEHLFSCAACGARAAEFDALVRGIQAAVRSASVGGFVTDAVLNRLSREGTRVRTFTLSPGAVVPCAVWDDDELMVLRLRGELGNASEVTLSQRVAGNEVSRATGQVARVARGEVLFLTPAAWIRELPVVDLELRLSAIEDGLERPIGSYTLAHSGLLHR
jgi:anti-sigma factor RsiW